MLQSSVPPPPSDRETSRTCKVCNSSSKKFVRHVVTDEEGTIIESSVVATGFLCFWCDNGLMSSQQYHEWVHKTQHGSILVDPTICPSEIGEDLKRKGQWKMIPLAFSF